MSICSWLQVKERNTSSESLRLGDAVTMNGELVGESVDMESIWATITKVINVENQLNKITDANNNKHHLPWYLVRHRKWHNISFGHVSNNKVHNCQAMQNFIKLETQALVKHILEECSEDLPVGGHIPCLHTHSDNASHFKSTGAMHVHTILVCDQEDANKT